MNGYVGKILVADLSAKSFEVQTLDEKTARMFVGGPALGAKYLFDNMPAKADPFGPESIIGFVCGPLNGAGAFFGGRYTVVSKSPVTGGWNDANSGGDFGARLKAAGFDAVFVKGISEKPVYIYIEDGKAELCDAADLWGLTTVAAEEKLKAVHGDKIDAALIAPAGERKDLTACVMNDEHRAAGRGGSGAVMGSKLLKAVVVKGTGKNEAADRAAVVALNREMAAAINPENPFAALMGPFGTGGSYVSSVLTNDAGIKNWAGSAADYSEEDAYPVSSQGMEKYNVGKYHCNSCPLGCGALYDLPTEDGVIHTSRPEYETMGAFGSMCLVKDAEAVIRCNFYCNEYGVDTISVGDTIAWAMECYDKGILTKEDLDGIELTWGNAAAAEELTLKMCKGEGVGAVLVQGSAYAAKHFGKGEECLVTASGIEIPMHDSRLSYGLARTFQYDPTPGRHIKGGIGIGVGGPDFDFENSGAADVAGTASTEMLNATGACLLGGAIHGRYLRQTLSAVTGWDVSEEEYLTMGKRSFNIRHAFNLREGLTKADFTLSERMIKANPPFEGPIAGMVVDEEKLANNFFTAMNWDPETLVPAKEELEALGLTEVAEELYK